MRPTVTPGRARTKRVSRRTPDPYNYCLDLELALVTLMSRKSRWHNLAGSFQNPTSVKSALLDASKRLRRRCHELTAYDDRLEILLDGDMSCLERAARSLGTKAGAEVNTVAALLSLAVHLLGYDWLDGRAHREVMYYQTKKQQRLDDELRHPPRTEEDVHFVWKERKKLIEHLHASGHRVARIAAILDLNEPVVKSVLVQAGALEREHNTKRTRS